MTSTIKAKGATILYKDITVTTGTAQYDGRYYGDYQNVVPTDCNPLSVVAVSSQSGSATNMVAIPQFIGRAVRLWSVRPSVKATLRVMYTKDII